MTKATPDGSLLGIPLEKSQLYREKCCKPRWGEVEGLWPVLPWSQPHRSYRPSVWEKGQGDVGPCLGHWGTSQNTELRLSLLLVLATTFIETAHFTVNIVKAKVEVGASVSMPVGRLASNMMDAKGTVCSPLLSPACPYHQKRSNNLWPSALTEILQWFHTVHHMNGNQSSKNGSQTWKILIKDVLVMLML